MTQIIIIICLSVLSFLTLWTSYLAVMALKRQRDRDNLPPVARHIGTVILVFGYTLDILFNWILGSIMFLDIPRQFTFSARLGLHIGEVSWRGQLARWFCLNLLDPFDPDGKHCKDKRK